MKVLFILHQTYACGGANKSFFALACALRDLGVEIHVATPDNESIYKELNDARFKTVVTTFRYGTYPDVKGAKDFILFVPRLIARRLVLRSAVKKLSRYIKENEIDIIHSNSSVLDIGFHLSNKTGIPHITHIREYGNTDFGYKYFPTWNGYHKHFQEPLQYSICITKAIQKHHGQWQSESSRTIYNGICHRNSFASHEAVNPYILYVGRIQETKGVFDLVKAYSLFKNTYRQDIPLKLIGKVVDESFYKILTDYITKNHLSGNIEFLGERNDIDHFMQEAITIVIPSFSEGFGRVMAEAMFNGCLVIGRDTAGTKEQFDNGLDVVKEDIGYRYNNINELSELLSKAISLDSEEKNKITKNANHVVNELYSIETSSLNVLSFYKEILK